MAKKKKGSSGGRSGGRPAILSLGKKASKSSLRSKAKAKTKTVPMKRGGVRKSSASKSIKPSTYPKGRVTRRSYRKKG